MINCLLHYILYEIQFPYDLNAATPTIIRRRWGLDPKSFTINKSWSNTPSNDNNNIYVYQTLER